MDVGSWLRSLGLGQYEAAFRDNEIDGKILPALTTEDLKELGVTVVGHRRRILQALGDLPGSPPAPVEATMAARPPQVATEQNTAERRQLTVMFCDLVGSTAMSARLDPEDMREVIAAYHQCCAALIASHGGFVAKYMGDGALAYFGYPGAHEDDAEHAVRAGLALVDASPKLVTMAGPLHMRVGIATGTVIVLRHRLLHGRAPDSLSPCRERVNDRLLELPSLGAMMRELFGLALDDLGKMSFQGGDDSRVDQMPLAAQQGAVGGVLHQCMFEGIFSVGRAAAPEHQFGADELIQRLVKLRLGHVRGRADQFVRELAPERRRDLGHLAGRRKAVKPRQQGSLQRRGDRQSRQARSRRVVVAGVVQDAAFDHGLWSIPRCTEALRRSAR
jgi:hypothetical protein